MKLRNCKRCGLWRSRTQVVFGRGPRKPRLILIGEGPGYNEDRTGKPFVGRAGKKTVEFLHGIGLKRKDVFIMNTICCRAPNNRTPTVEELEACRPRLIRTLHKLDCSMILCLGGIAVKAVIGDFSISEIRGRMFLWGKEKKRVFATYHPAYVLRNPRVGKIVKDDFDFIRYHLEEVQWEV